MRCIALVIRALPKWAHGTWDGYVFTQPPSDLVLASLTTPWWLILSTPAILQTSLPRSLALLPHPPTALLLPRTPLPEPLPPPSPHLPTFVTLAASTLLEHPALPQTLRARGYGVALDTALLTPPDTYPRWWSALQHAAPALLFCDPRTEDDPAEPTPFQGVAPRPAPSFYQALLSLCPETPVALTRPSALQAVVDRALIRMWDSTPPVQVVF